MCRGWEVVYHSLDIFHQFLWSYWPAKLEKKKVKLINGLFHVVVIFANIMNSKFCLTSLEFEKNILVMHSKRSWGKTQELESLRLLENFHHNMALKHNVLIVMRCTTSIEEFQPCTHCYGFLQHNELWRHIIKRLVLLKGRRTVRKMNFKVRNTDKTIFNNEANCSCHIRSQVSAISSMIPLHLWNLMR